MSGAVDQFNARLRVRRRVDAVRAQAILADFARERLPDLLDQAIGRGQLTLDRVVIDLGRVRPADLAARLETAVTHSLAAAIQREASHARGPRMQGASALDPLRLRLETGRAHWRDGGRDLEALFSHALKADSAAVRRTLNALGKLPHVAQRLRRQLPPSALEALALTLPELGALVSPASAHPGDTVSLPVPDASHHLRPPAQVPPVEPAGVVDAGLPPRPPAHMADPARERPASSVAWPSDIAASKADEAPISAFPASGPGRLDAGVVANRAGPNAALERQLLEALRPKAASPSGPAANSDPPERGGTADPETALGRRGVEALRLTKAPSSIGPAATSDPRKRADAAVPELALGRVVVEALRPTKTVSHSGLAATSDAPERADAADPEAALGRAVVEALRAPVPARLLAAIAPPQRLASLLPLASPAFGGLLRYAAERMCAFDPNAAAHGVAQALAQAIHDPPAGARTALAQMLAAAAAAAAAPSGRSSAQFAAAWLAAERRSLAPEAPARAALLDLLASCAVPAAPFPESTSSLATASSRTAEIGLAVTRARYGLPERSSSAAARSAPPLHDSERPSLEDDPTATAGLVILWPFLQRGFAAMGLCDGTSFRNTAAQRRAVLLLHRLATGAAEASEHLLLLEKTLCGLGPTEPTDLTISPDDAEIAAGEALLTAVRGHWPGLAGTSNAALAEVFLARRGRLKRAQESAPLVLEVAPGPFDMLLGRIPWALSVVRLAWMQEALYVRWR